MPRVTVIAALLVLVLLSFAAPSASAQDGFAAQPEELWEEFPLDSDKQKPPKPEQSAPPKPEEKQAAPQAPAPSEGERVADEAGGDSDNGLALWLLPVLGLLAFVGGVLAAKAALRFSRRRRQTTHERPASAEQAAAKPEPKPSTDAAPKRPTPAPKPAEKEKPMPVKKPAPVAAAKPAPVKAEKPAPVKEQKPAPVEEQKPAPVEEQKPAPEKQDRPAPVTAEKPAPAKPAVPKEERPAPVAPAKPAVAKAEKPVVAKAEKPAPVNVEKPAPVKAQKPAPVAPPKPAAAPEPKPAPVRAQAVTPNDETPRPAEAQEPTLEQKPKLEAPAPAAPKESQALPDDVIPFPTRADRIGRRSGASSTPARALGYVSAADTDSHVSDLEAQTEEIRKACVRNGFESVEVVRDFESHSGSDLERPGLIYAIERLEAGEASCLVVTSLERLTRSAAHLGTLIDRLGESRIRLVVLDIQLDTGNPDGRLAAEALANVGTLERKSLDTRTRKGLEAARDARRSSGRPAVADRPALKERIAEMRARGMTLQAIADTLNSEGVPTLRGGSEWRPSSVQAAVGYKRPKRGARKSANGRSGGTPDPQVNGVSGGSSPADKR